MIFTMGYGGRSLQEFVQILKANAIKEVIDVRAFPTSKYPEFKRENLNESLSKEGISYLHLKELGGYRRPSYEEFTKTEEFRLGIDRLLGEAKDKNVAVMCMERDYKACHRRFISGELERRGVGVAHL